MGSFVKIQVALLLIYSCTPPIAAISNIFKSFPIFSWALDNNNGTFSAQGANTTNHSDGKETCIPPLLLNGLIDPPKIEYKTKDIIRVTCKAGFELEDKSSSVLYCSPQGLWQVFTFDNDGSIPLPRCIATERCPPLPALIQGSMQVQEGRSNGPGKKATPTTATYKCWAGYRLDPSDSSTRYCNAGKWSGQNPKCVRASCTRPPSITRGYFTSRGIVNHVYQPGSAVRYHCDSGYQLNGPSILTCSDIEWTPKEIPSCSLIRQPNVTWPMMRGCPLPPPIANGQFEILPMKQHPRSGVNSSTWPAGVVPIYSSAVYSCQEGFTLRGSSLISCTAHGWWQPPYNTPRCFPDGPDPGTNAIHRPVNANGGSRRGATDGNGKVLIHPWMFEGEDDGSEYDHEDDGTIERWTPVVSLSMAFGVVLVLGLVWIASRCKSLYRVPPSPSSASGSRCFEGQLWWSRFVSASRRPACASVPSAVDDEEDRPPGRICGTYLNIHQPSTRPGSADDADRLALINTDQQMMLPSYEEAVRSTIHHNSHQHANRYVWPMAPPPYDAVVSSSSSSSSNPEPAAGAAIENPPTVIHHQGLAASSCSQAEDEQRVVVAEQPALPGQHEAVVCIDHRDDSESAASSGSRENLVP